MEGYIKIYRQIKDWQHFQEPSVLLLFIDILVSANFKRGSYRGIAVGKGALITSYRKLSEETGLAVNTIRECIAKLVESGEITLKPTKGQYTHIVVNHYSKFQAVSTIDTLIDTPTDTLIDTPTDTLIDTPTDTPIDTPTDTLIDTPTDTPIDTPNIIRRIRKKEEQESSLVSGEKVFSPTPINNEQNQEGILNGENSKPKLTPEERKAEKEKSCAKKEKEFQEMLRPFLDQYGRDMLNEFYMYWSEWNKTKTQMKWQKEGTWDTARRLARWANNSKKFGDSNSTNSKSPQLYRNEGNNYNETEF